MYRRSGGGKGKPQRSMPALALSRMRIVYVGMLLALVWIAVAVSQVQVFDHRALAVRANRELRQTITIPAHRGTIYDRNGRVLALDVNRPSLYVVPELVPPERTAVLGETLAAILGEPSSDVLAALTDPEARWRLIKRTLEPAVAERVDALEEPALRFLYEPQRLYPQGTLAAHVLGGINANGDGIGGVETSYGTILSGATGVITAEVDALNVPIPLTAPQIQAVRHGASVTLTLDIAMQHQVEQVLASAVEQHQADSGTVVIIETATGAVRAMASYPTYDPNRYAEYPPEYFYQNPAIAHLYEPGSTFKIVTAAAGLRSGAFTPQTTVEDTGIVDRYGIALQNWNGAPNGSITPAQMLYYSSNVGALRLNEMTGAENFYDAVRDFGFGRMTGIDAAGEAPGLVPNPNASDWSPISLDTNAYGQGIAATPLQVARMLATIGNDGVPMRPYLVDMYCTEQECHKTMPQAKPAVVPAEVAQAIRGMLVSSGNHYVNAAPPDNLWLVPGFAVGAKTGTSSIPDPAGGYGDGTIGSVGGIVPADAPRYAMLVMIVRPKDDIWGVRTALPVFQSLAAYLTTYSGLLPDPARVGPDQTIGGTLVAP